MTGGLQGFYQRSPGWLQTILLNGYALRLYSIRDGASFRTLFAEWNRSQWRKPEEIRAAQDARLRDQVQVAARLPFYRQRFQRAGVRPEDIRGIGDLPRLPLLTKQEVREAGHGLLIPANARGLTHGHTSGTTGSPLNLWYDRAMVIANNVADYRQKAWGGMRRGEWCGIFLGRVVVPVTQRKAPFWRPNFVHRHMWFSSFHMSDDVLPQYVAQIRKSNIQFLDGYPSTLFILARHLLRRGERLPMRGVFTSSETLTDIQREAIEDAFQCRNFDFYGEAERVVFAAECDRHDGKHLFDEYGVTEIVDDAGQPVPDGQMGWVVGTSLWNGGMPLLRYRLSDTTRKLTGPCSCGRGLSRIANITTKAEDIILTPDGRYVSPSVITHPFKPFDEILKSQVIQVARDEVVVRLVVSRRFTDAQRAELLEGLRIRLGQGMKLTTEIVDEILPEPSGKFRWVISRVPHSRIVDWNS